MMNKTIAEMAKIGTADVPRWKNTKKQEKYVWCEVINILSIVIKLLCKPESMLGVGAVNVDGTTKEWYEHTSYILHTHIIICIFTSSRTLPVCNAKSVLVAQVETNSDSK